MQEFLNTQLKPYNALTREEKHILLDAVIDGVAEVWHDDWEVFTPKTCPVFHENNVYRTKPKEYKKLEIPWQLIDDKWKYAAMDCTGETYFFLKNPDRFTGEVWQSGISSFCKSPLKLDTTGIIAEHSLTQRPTGSDTDRPE